MQFNLSCLCRSAFRGPVALVVLCLLFAATLAPDAHSAEFYAVIANQNHAKHPHAHINVSVDTGAGTGLEVDFLVRRATDGQILTSFVLYTNMSGFCSSSSAAAPMNDLFKVSGGETALIYVRTPIGAPTSSAVVHEDLGDSKIVFSMPPIRSSTDASPLAAFEYIAVPVGAIGKGTSLFIVNVTSVPVEVDIYVGTRSIGALRYTNPEIQAFSVWQVDLLPADARSHLIVSSQNPTIPVVVQLAVDQGKGNISMTSLLRP